MDHLPTIREKIQDSRYICQSELDKSCFQHNMDYGDFKDLPDFKQLLIEHYIIEHLILLKNQKFDGYQREIAPVIYKFSFMKRPLEFHLPK